MLPSRQARVWVDAGAGRAVVLIGYPLTQARSARAGLVCIQSTSIRLDEKAVVIECGARQRPDAASQAATSAATLLAALFSGAPMLVASIFRPMGALAVKR